MHCFFCLVVIQVYSSQKGLAKICITHKTLMPSKEKRMQKKIVLRCIFYKPYVRFFINPSNGFFCAQLACQVKLSFECLVPAATPKFPQSNTKHDNRWIKKIFSISSFFLNQNLYFRISYKYSMFNATGAKRIFIRVQADIVMLFLTGCQYQPSSLCRLFLFF